MELSAAEGRVLGCLVNRQAAKADGEALTLDELRFACNQTHGRGVTVCYDDRTVDEALVALKSKGLARFVVQGGRGLGPVQYRHRADERWRLSPAELAVLAALLLRGPQTRREVHAAVGTALVAESVEVEAALDALAGRTPEPFAIRFVPSGWGETLWTEVLTGIPSAEQLSLSYQRRDRRAGTSSAPRAPGDVEAVGASTADVCGSSAVLAALTEVVERLAAIEDRLAGIEAALGPARAGPRGQEAAGRPDRPPYRPPGGQRSSRVSR